MHGRQYCLHRKKAPELERWITRICAPHHRANTSSGWSFLGYTAYKVSLVPPESELIAAALLILPVFILAALMKIVPPWAEAKPLGKTAGAD